MSDIESRYHTNLLEYGFKELSTTNELSGIGRLYSVPKEYGEGTYWIYSEKDLYDIKIHDFCFHKDSFFDFGIPQGCLGICYYESISGEEISPYRKKFHRRNGAMQNTNTQKYPCAFCGY